MQQFEDSRVEHERTFGVLIDGVTPYHAPKVGEGGQATNFIIHKRRSELAQVAELSVLPYHGQRLGLILQPQPHKCLPHAL